MLDTTPFGTTRRTMRLAHRTAPRWIAWLALASLLVGVLPALAAWLGKRLVDTVVEGGASAHDTSMWLLAAEAAVMVALLAAKRGGVVVRALLGLRLSESIRERVAKKSVALELADLESPVVQDQLTRARKQAGSRPIAYIEQSSVLAQSILAMGVAVVLLFQVHPLAMLVVLVAGIPGFIAELRWVRRHYGLELSRTTARRELGYLENVLAREDYAKEARLLGLGRPLRARFRSLADALFREQAVVQVSGARAVVLTGAFGTTMFYVAYFAVVYATIQQRLSLGEMTMALVLLRQSQTAATAVMVSTGRLMQGKLYMSELFAFLDRPAPNPAEGLMSGPKDGDGIRFENVSFTYPGADAPALRDVSLHLAPGAVLGVVGENGSGKSTLIKLLTRLYDVEHGRITLDGLDLRQWNRAALWRRTAAMFQDFARFKFTMERNVEIGDESDGDRLRRALQAGGADAMVESLGKEQRLGRGFPGGVDLSGGQWQKLALARVFFREDADVRVFDEPTAALDAHAEAAVFDRIFERGDTMTIVVAHRLSTLRRADEIIVLHEGQIAERGTHRELLENGEQYASLFATQAASYDR